MGSSLHWEAEQKDEQETQHTFHTCDFNFIYNITATSLECSVVGHLYISISSVCSYLASLVLYSLGNEANWLC